MLTLYLTRHGQTEANRDKRFTGQLDSRLTPKGLAQAQALAEVLRPVSLTAIYASSLGRTRETACPSSEMHGLPIRQVEDLNEMHLGILQGQYRDSLDDEHRKVWQAYKAQKRVYRIPDGETFEELAKRVSSCLWGILGKHHEEETLLIVGHRNTNRILLAELMQWPDSQWLELDIRSKFLYRVMLTEPPMIDTFFLDGSQRGARREGFVC